MRWSLAIWPIERMVSTADLARALGQDVDAGLQLVALLVEQEVVVAEMRAADVPVEVLGLDVERERVGDQRIERRRYLTHRLGRQIGRGVEPRGRGTRFEVFSPWWSRSY